MSNNLIGTAMLRVFKNKVIHLFLISIYLKFSMDNNN